MQAAILEHLQAFQNAYDKIGWLPKHHMATHLPFQKWPLLNCLVHERRHKLAKRWSRDRFNLASFEEGLITQLTLHHLHDLRERSDLDDG